MTRLQSQQGIVLRQKFLVRPGLRSVTMYSDQYTSLPNTVSTNTDQDFPSLQSECDDRVVGGKMMLLSKDLITISHQPDNNNNGPEGKW